MDNLILFTPSKDSHTNKLKDILNALLKNGTEDITQEVPIIQNQLTIHGK